MTRGPLVNPLEGYMECKSKHQYLQVVTAEKKFKDAIYNNMRIYMPAVVIAILENGNVKWSGIERWRSTLMKAIEECAADDDLTVFKVLEDETGLELQLGDGRSYKETAFANPDLFDKNMNDKNPLKWIRYFQNKANWSPCTVMSACLLACHRQFHWSAEGKLSEINLRAVEIVEFCKRKPKMIARECERVTGRKVMELFKD